MKRRYQLEDALNPTICNEDSIQLIKSDPEAYSLFQEFPPEHQDKILHFIQGTQGLPVVYDPFFKMIFNPSTTPERLERFLSSLMNQKIHIVDIIPREGTQMIEKGSFVIMDILVQTEDGSYINVEMQKYGYKFTGERSTCYMADLIMRQYTKVKSIKKSNFTFKDMKPVYLIILMEKSSQNFIEVSPEYIHRAHYICDTGAEIKFLANYTYISLDTFRSVSHNINSYLDAWFTFLSSDSPNDILKLINAYPEFLEYYHDIAIFRTKPRELMTMYSEVLAQIDRNTELLMIEEMNQEIEKLRLNIAEMNTEYQEVLLAIQNKNFEIQAKDSEIQAKDSEIQAKDSEIQAKDSEIQAKDIEIAMNLFKNGADYDLVRNSIKSITDDELISLYESTK